MLNSFKQYVMSVHGEKVQSSKVLPFFSPPELCDAGTNHDPMNIEPRFESRKSVEERKNERGGNNSSGDQEKKTRQHVCDLCYKTFTLAGSLKTHMMTHTGTKPFVCGLCGKAFTLACNLKSHELIHTGQKPFVCDVCNKAFTQASHLKAHKRIHTGERPYKCPYCEADFNQSNHVQKHIRTVHGSNSRYMCEVAFPTFDDLERHKRIESEGKAHSDSGERSTQSSLPGNQSLIHTGLSAVRRDPQQSRQGAEGSQKMTEEDDCEEDNADCDDLGLRQFEGHCHPGPQHLSEEQPLSATVMSSQTTPQSRAEPTGGGLGESGQNKEKGKEEVLFSFIKRKPANYVTLQLPKQDEIIYCEDCDRESQGDCPQHRHFQVQSSGVSSVRAAPLCDPSCPDPTSPDLSRSMLTLDRGHVCRRCSASFIMFNSLKLHTLCIHGEKLLTALPPLSPPIPAAPDDGDGGSGNHDDMNEEPDDYDHQSFDSDERNVADGNSVHTRKDNKSYVTGNKFDVKKTNRQICDICFKSVTYLKTHKLTHTGYKEFKCSRCSKAFSLACNLKAHELTHTGQKPFVCDVCGKAFTQGSHLKAHRRIHTGERPYKCPHCQADFNQSNHVQKHIRTVHSGDRHFVCEICGGAFSRSADLEKHKKVHSGGKDRAKKSARSRKPKSAGLSLSGEDFCQGVSLSADEDS